MSRRERSIEELRGVSTADMTAAEYRKTNDDHFYEVVTEQGTHIRVRGIHSAQAVAGDRGTYTKE